MLLLISLLITAIVHSLFHNNKYPGHLHLDQHADLNPSNNTGDKVGNQHGDNTREMLENKVEVSKNIAVVGYTDVGREMSGAKQASLGLSLLYLDRLGRMNPEYSTTVSSADMFLQAQMVAKRRSSLINVQPLGMSGV